MSYEKDYRKRILNFYYENGKENLRCLILREIAKNFGCRKKTVRVALKKLGYIRKKQTKYRKQGISIERKNNKIKIIKRLSYEIKKFDNLKKLIKFRIS